MYTMKNDYTLLDPTSLTECSQQFLNGTPAQNMLQAETERSDVLNIQYSRQTAKTPPDGRCAKQFKIDRRET